MRILFISFVAVLSLAVAPCWAQAPAVFMGYSAATTQAEQQWEAKFRAIPVAANIREYNKYLSAYPHHAGTERGKENAEWILSKFKQWGWDAHIETFYVLLPWPKERVVEMVSPSTFKATLQEPTIPVDPTSSQHNLQLPTYNMYSTDGDVTAPLVYVNFGRPSDYDELARLGVSVKGAIVIARYGDIWRGLKPKIAAEHGAIGCLIYSDPHEDGYWKGEVFPKGPYRPREGVQRGSVMDLIRYPGDPLTPGIGATKDAHRLPLSQVKVFTRIPVLPLSYGDAQPLLAAMGGRVAPPDWRGALPITYHIGPGPARVHLKLASNWDVRPIYDVIARIPGSSDAGEWVIRGNHHDAWVNGSSDPISGLTGMMEGARALGELVKQGWKPRRTIIYCAWDAEEEGLIGSTEWAEEHTAALRQHAVAYINSDMNMRGYLDAEGSPTLQKFVNSVAADITDPEKHISVEQRLRLRQISHASSQSERDELRGGGELKLGVLGSGSDFSAFLDHVGIPTLVLSFGGEGSGAAGVYHSIYDDFYWFSHFGDPTFEYGRALAQMDGSAMMRLADAPLLPIDFEDLSRAAQSYLKDAESAVSNRRAQARQNNRQLSEGIFEATSDPLKHLPAAAMQPVPPYVNFAPLKNAAVRLAKAAGEYHKLVVKSEADGGAALDHDSMARVNDVLRRSEQALAMHGGLPGRPWYKNALYAPGIFTGYDARTLPAVREQIALKNWQQADVEIQKTAAVLDQETQLIHEASQTLEGALK